MKAKCGKCNRLVGVSCKGVAAKHHVGRSNPTKVKPICKGSGAVCARTERKVVVKAVVDSKTAARAADHETLLALQGVPLAQPDGQAPRA